MIGVPSIFLPFYRKPSAGWLFGVCAGIGEIVGIRPWILRTSLVLAVYFSPFYVLLAYAALGLLFRAKRMLDGDGSRSSAEWATATSQSTGLRTIDDQYEELETRLTSLESEALSKETDLRRRFREAGL
jgi:phage shock protein C